MSQTPSDYNMHRYQDMDFWDESTSSSVLEEITDISAAYAENFTAGRDTIDHAVESATHSAMELPDYRIFGSSSDLIMLTSDHVCFYLDSGMIWASTNNDFNGMLVGFSSGFRTESGATPIFTVPEASVVFTMIVCAIYGQPFAEYGPSFETLDQAIDGMHSYGIPLETILAPSTPLSEILLTHKDRHAIELYALAGHYSIDHLAVAASFFLLSYRLSSLSDEIAVRIGPQYLKRLFFMHLGRSEALRRSLFPPPYPHEPTPECSRADQMLLTRAWSLAASSLAWDSSADVSGEAIGVVLSALGDHLTCGQCQTALADRIDILLERWASTKRSI